MISYESQLAEQDAGIIARVLGIEVRKVDFLLTSASDQTGIAEALKKTIQYINDSKADMLIISVREELTRPLQKLIAQRICGLSGNFAGRGDEGLKPGETLLVHVKKETYTLIHPKPSFSGISQ